MSNVSDIEADEILTKFVELRERCKKSKSKALHIKYKKQTELCASKFDYIVQNKVRKYKSFSNYDDLLQDGRLALVLALDSYQLDKGSWFWWANQYVKTKIYREANRHSTIKIPIKQTKNFLPYKVSQLPIMIDTRISALDSMETSEQESLIHSAVLSLPPIERKVIQMYYEMDTSKDNSSITSICCKLNITNKECKRILCDARKLLRENLENVEVHNERNFNIYQ